ncbi:MAG: DUF2254 domain-containing protein [Verrucomicrobiales bacterium]|nr:DUF2254 domain-containing protein [Verrucomicrobiales bacterium]
MIVRLLNRGSAEVRRITSSLGFIPTIISILFGLAAITLLWANTTEITTFLLENAPSVVIKDGDTARVILSTVIGGLLSLTVFTFTMVMAQLNRAASNYSPRLLPGLISTTRHQVILGIFLGAILFCLIVLITIEPSDDSYQLPGLAILLSVLLAISSLGIFVYFIHSISQSIQVTNILQRIADETVQRLDELLETDERNQHASKPDFKEAMVVRSNKTGYFQVCNRAILIKLAIKHDLLLEVIPLQGEFVLENTRLMRLSKKVDEEVEEEMRSCFQFFGDGYVKDNYALGFKYITEIAVRAMSPGTNDPGTALSAINHLTHLTARRMMFDDYEIHFDEDGEPRAIISVISLEELLYVIFAALRLYCKHDAVIVFKLLQMFDYLLQQPMQENSRHDEVLKDELRVLIADARESLTNEKDLKMLESRIEKLGCDI